MATPILLLQDIRLTFGGTPLLEGADLSVEPGARVCLIGRNGCGKSTLLKIAAGRIEPDAGRRFLQPGTTVQYLEQEPDFSDFETTRAYVEAGLGPTDDPHIAQRLLEKVGLTGDETPATLSGGEARRAALARALAPRPDVLLLDEPTNHLDIQHQLSILDLVAKLSVTSVVALHDLNQALSCDRVGVMAGGRLVALGAPHEVLTVERIGAAFGVRASIVSDPSDGARMFRFHPAS